MAVLPQPPYLTPIFDNTNTMAIAWKNWFQLLYTQVGTGTTDSSNVTYKYPTSNNTRTVQTKLSEYVSVTDFGAVGDGVTDDSLAFVQALSTKKKVFIPWTAAGYNLGVTTIPITVGMTLVGEKNDTVLHSTAPILFNITSDETAETSLENFRIDMPAAPTGSIAIQLNSTSQQVSRVRLKHLTFVSCYTCITDINSTAHGTQDITLDEIYCYEGRNRQIVSNYSTGFMRIKNTLINLVGGITNCNWTAIYINNAAGIELELVDILGRGTATAYQSASIAVQIQNSVAVWLKKVFCEQLAGHGIALATVGYPRLIDCTVTLSYGIPWQLTSVSDAWGDALCAVGGVGIAGAGASAHGFAITSCTDLKFTNIQAFNNTGSGISLVNTFDSSLVNFRSTNNLLCGIIEGGTSSNNSYLNCVLGLNGSSDSLLTGSTSKLTTGRFIVDGPTSAISGNLASYDGTKGTLIKDSGVSVSSGSITSGTWNGSIIGLTYGGTSANLTASAGGIVYSTSSALSILSGTATANKILLSSASSAPVWSTPTFPNASATTGKNIQSDGTNWVSSTSTWPTTATQGGIIYSDTSNSFTQLAKDTNTSRYLSNQGTSNAPAWQLVNLVNGVTGTLAVANGGSGVTIMPAFRAFRSGTQALASGAAAKVQLNAETFDTNSNFDSTTNFRFTPTVAGKYQINAGLTIVFSTGDTTTDWAIYIYKNGSVYAQIELHNILASTTNALSISDIVDMNGSTDFIEMFAAQVSGGSRNISGATNLTWMSGVRVSA